jgi:hypothetical protein
MYVVRPTQLVATCLAADLAYLTIPTASDTVEYTITISLLILPLNSLLMLLPPG